MGLEVGDEVTVLHISSSGLVLQKRDGKVLIVHPYCSCNSGFWWLSILPEEKIPQASDSVKHIFEQALSRK
jgi:hypothetical protein